jgi:hypothetical protein
MTTTYSPKPAEGRPSQETMTGKKPAKKRKR